MMFLIDTDTIIYSLKKHPAVVANFETHQNEPMAISAITYGELAYGAWRSRNKTSNLATVRRLAELFPVIEVSRAIMDTFGEVKAALRGQGRPLDDMDLLIGATALSQNYALVTNNERHFSLIPGLTVHNWTKSP